jgi:hypothetical protein
VRLGTNLSEDEKRIMSDLLEQYSTTFSSDPGSTGLITHRVMTTDDIPVRQRPYRLPHAMRCVVKTELDKMLSGGIIEPANSPYGSPIVLIKKSDKS